MTVRSALALALLAAWLGVFGVISGVTEAAAQPAVPAILDASEAEAPPVSRPLLEPASDGRGFVLSADFEVPLTRSLEDAISRGVPLYFIAEFELRRPRWQWLDDLAGAIDWRRPRGWLLDELVVERETTWRLAHHALTRQYRLTVSGVIHPFDSLDEALRALARVRNWRVLDAGQVEPGVEYEAQVRLRLDTSQLPKPFQIGGLTNRDWNPQAEWKRFKFTPPTPKSAR